MLSDAVTSARAAHLLLTGEPIDADIALEWGLVTEVVAADVLAERAHALATRIATLPWAAVTRTKAALRRNLSAAAPGELAALGGIQGTLLTGPDFRSAADRFRSP